MKVLLLSIVFLGLIGVSYCGPLAYGICQTGCNAVGVACYAAGAIFGIVITSSGVPLVILGHNSVLGVCMVGCVTAGFAPTL